MREKTPQQVRAEAVARYRAESRARGKKPNPVDLMNLSHASKVIGTRVVRSLQDWDCWGRHPVYDWEPVDEHHIQVYTGYPRGKPKKVDVRDHGGSFKRSVRAVLGRGS